MEEFEQVLAESMALATNQSIEYAQEELATNPLVATAAGVLLEAWTDPNSLPAPHGLLVDAFTQIIEHPAKPDMDEEDAKQIAQVWMLGKVVVACAKHALEQNPEFQKVISQDDSMFRTFDMFAGNAWYRHHQGSKQMEEKTPDVLRAERLKTWPYGDYINCLGVAIGLSAASELTGQRYYFGNELRGSQAIINLNHAALMQRFDQLEPGFFERQEVHDIFAFRDKFYEQDEAYADILFDMPGILRERELPRDFHHFIVMAHPKHEGHWMQLDPYAIVADFVPEPQRFELGAGYTQTAAGMTDVIVHNNGASIDELYRDLDRAIARAGEFKHFTQRTFMLGTEYKSDAWFDRMYDATEIAMLDICDRIGFDKEKDIDNTKVELTHLWFGALDALTAHLPDGTKLRAETAKLANAAPRKKEGDDTSEFGAHFHKVEAHIQEAMKKDTVFREKVFETMRSMPATLLASIYRTNLEESLRVRNLGTVGSSFEIGDSAFMIGAMYMNHYATWRKDGRINIARHLARLTASQLIWQAAQQDGTETDERVQAVGEVIQTLSARQLHPLVNIARTIHN